LIRLSLQQFEKAKSYIQNNGRSLEKAWLDYYFENGSKEKVILELSKYQNEDGGFGHALEPDFFYPGSSPAATTIAFQFLVELDIREDHEMVQQGIQYFLETVDHEKGQWRRVPYEVNQYPHASWWHQTEEMEEYSGNVSAEIIGYLHKYASLVDNDLLQSLTNRCLEHLKNRTKVGMHEFVCYVRMAEQLPEHQKNKVIQLITKAAYEWIETDSEKWKEYCLHPLWVIDSTQSPFYQLFKTETEHNIDYLIKNQNPLGNWDPYWKWPEDPKNWELAKHNWKSYLTFLYLKRFDIFGRIENR
jgi:hypothetical protein